MVSGGLRWTLLAALAVGLWGFWGGCPSACAFDHGNGSVGLFYNYYAPVGPSGVPAQLYVSPRPTPPMVGHTYVTYEALAPHEFLYRHHRVYSRYHPGGGATVTKVRWH